MPLFWDGPDGLDDGDDEDPEDDDDGDIDEEDFLDLDVEDPAEVPGVLRAAAKTYLELRQVTEWRLIAEILESAAERIEKVLV